MSARNTHDLTTPPLRESNEEVRAKFVPVEKVQPREQIVVGAVGLRFSDLAEFINTNVADSPDKEHALRVLKDAAMWTTQAIVSK